MNTRSGARKGDNQTYIDLLSPGQHDVKSRLTLVTRDLFTIPAMSDESERIFSSAGLMTTPHRGRLSARAIGEA
jgi:hypothetical protein